MGRTPNEQRSVAYFSMEIGIETGIPTYRSIWNEWDEITS